MLPAQNDLSARTKPKIIERGRPYPQAVRDESRSAIEAAWGATVPAVAPCLALRPVMGALGSAG